MRKVSVFAICLVVLSGVVTAVHSENANIECWEQTLCPEPEEYPRLDFVNEVSISDEGLGASWNGTVDIRRVSFEHNFTERVENGSFETIDESSGREKAGGKSLSFDGVMKVNSMCNEPIFEVDVVKSSKYTINVYGNDTYGVRSCTEQPVKVEYTLTLDTYTQDMEAVVMQNNVTESFQTENYHGLPRGPEDQEDFEDNERKEEQPSEGIKQDDGGLLSGAIGIFSSFFGIF